MKAINLTPDQQAVLLAAAAILEAVPDAEASPFSLDGYEESFELSDQAGNLREMVGVASGDIQYEYEIGPEPLRLNASMAAVRAAMMESLNLMRDMLIATRTNQEFEASFAAGPNNPRIGASVDIRTPVSWLPIITPATSPHSEQT